MTKTEKAALDALQSELRLIKAWRLTDAVLPDIPAPTGMAAGIVNGWIYIAHENGRVEKACSDAVHHGVGHWDKTSTQGARALYSTRLLAYKALRHTMEREMQVKLARIDDEILKACADANSGDDL